MAGVAYSTASWALGRIDLIYGFICPWIQSSTSKFFNKGFGDIPKSVQLDKSILEKGLDGFSDIEVEWTKKEGGVKLGEFDSPLRDYLPDESKRGYITLLEPDSELKGIVVHLAATGDMDTAYRLRAVARPLASYGFASVILVVPFYGLRKPKSQPKHFVETVADYLIASSGNFVEGAKLVKWCRSQYPSIPVGITGISYGGAMSTIAAILDDGDLALSPCVGAPSPRALIEGTLRAQVNFKALQNDRNLSTEAEAHQHLDDILGEVHLFKLVDHFKNRERRSGTLTAVCVNASHDEIVPSGRDVHVALRRYSLLQEVSDPTEVVKQEWIAGGHVSAIVLASFNFIQPIIHSFELLAKLTGK